MKSSIDLKVYVEVDTKEKYPYRVMCYANGKIFTACKDMMTAKNMCDMINQKNKSGLYVPFNILWIFRLL